MKFVLFVEGHTEYEVIGPFLKRWLDPKLSERVGITVVRFDGWQELEKDARKKAELHLRQTRVIAVISLLDLYGPTFYPDTIADVDGRYEWGTNHMQDKVDQEKFFHFFAVHEIEAWLLSEPSIFPPDIRTAVDARSQDPESVNDTQPPSKLLDKIYERETKRRYKKVVHGKALFKKLDPEIAYKKCPHLELLLDKMLELAENSGH